MSRIRLLPTLTALVLTFALLFGGYQIYRNVEVLQPLQNQLRQVTSVQSVQIVTVAQAPTVVVRLGVVNDLQSTYNQIQNVILNTLGSPVAVTIHDASSPELKKVYEQLQPILYQGIARGDYVNMISQFKKTCKNYHIDCKISMNSQDIFIQLMKNKSYLYDIASYSLKSSGVSA